MGFYCERKCVYPRHYDSYECFEYVSVFAYCLSCSIIILEISGIVGITENRLQSEGIFRLFFQRPLSIEKKIYNRLRRLVMWNAMAFIVLLFFLSVYGAFLGSQRAKEFFNDVPLIIYWGAFILLLVVGIFLFKRLLRVPALLLIHAGCIFILAGAIWSSGAGHELRKNFFGIDKIQSGLMQIYEGRSDNRVILQDDKIRELPFYIKLRDFRLEHYKPEYLRVQSRRGDNLIFPVEVDTDYSIGSGYGTIRIIRVFENFRINLEGDNRVVIDEPGPGSNPALEVQIQSPDGLTETKYVFERFPGHAHSEDELFLSYQRIISEYISELQVICEGKVVAEKDIQVNHPLHYGGYHFYQQDYDHQAGRFTVLEVTSDSGLNLVYAGYLMLCVGLCWHFWINKLSGGGERIFRAAQKGE